MEAFKASRWNEFVSAEKGRFMFSLAQRSKCYMHLIDNAVLPVRDAHPRHPRQSCRAVSTVARARAVPGGRSAWSCPLPPRARVGSERPGIGGCRRAQETVSLELKAFSITESTRTVVFSEGSNLRKCLSDEGELSATCKHARGAARRGEARGPMR